MKYSVGKSLDTKCDRCTKGHPSGQEMVLTHTIMAMIDGQVIRVKCNTCGSEHKYRELQYRKERRAWTGSSSKSGSSKNSQINYDYEALLKKCDLSRIKNYQSTDSFQQNQAINHPKFGVGIVVEQREYNKISVCFQEGTRILLQAPKEA